MSEVDTLGAIALMGLEQTDWGFLVIIIRALDLASRLKILLSL